jgi:signal transduction histidine kinase/ActR/RegA family two-component response regulator
VVEIQAGQSAQAARLRQFLEYDLVVNAAMTTLVFVFFLIFRSGVFVVIGLEVLANNAVLLWARTRAEDEQLDEAILATCVALWIINLTVAFTIPAVFPFLVLLAVWPVALALPYLHGRRLQEIMVVSSLVSLSVTILALPGDRFGVMDIVPAWVVNAVMLTAIPIGTGFICLLLWHYSSRLTETLDQTRRSELRLKAEVMQRTSDLAKALDKALEASRAKSAFLANMSHELRTPLNAVIGFSQVLLKQQLGELNEQQQVRIGYILSSGRQLEVLITDILDLSKIEAGRLELELGELLLSDAVESSLTVVRDLASQHNISISSTIDPTIDRLEADPRRFNQILNNLLTNAVKFTPDGGQVRIAAWPVGTDVCVAVSDSGIGIAPEDLDRIFEVFERVRRPGVEVDGVGLGLPLTRQLVELHHGRLWVESQLGIGSTFTFTVPLRQPGALALDSSHTQSLEQSAGATAGELVLVVEDDPKSLALMRDALRGSGYQTIEATTARDGVQLARSAHPDLIVMDIRLPDMSGLDAVHELRAADETASIPVIALSAFAMPSDRQRAEEAGVQTYLTKPVDVPKFLAQVYLWSKGSTEA